MLDKIRNCETLALIERRLAEHTIPSHLDNHLLVMRNFIMPKKNSLDTPFEANLLNTASLHTSPHHIIRLQNPDVLPCTIKSLQKIFQFAIQMLRDTVITK